MVGPRVIRIPVTWVGWRALARAHWRWLTFGVVVAVATAVGVGLLIDPAASRAEADAPCVVPAGAVTVTATNQVATNGATSVGDRFQLTTRLAGLDGMKVGCRATVALPKELFTGLESVTRFLNDDQSASAVEQPGSVASMVVDAASATVTFTLTAYAATHRSVSVTGFVDAEVTDLIQRGQTTAVIVRVNGEDVTVTEITGAGCARSCPTVPSKAAKHGRAALDGTGSVAITTWVAPTAGSEVTVTDRLIGGRQRIVGLAAVKQFTCVDEWGTPGLAHGDACDTATFVPLAGELRGSRVTVRTTADNAFVEVTLTMAFTGSGPWRDEATVTMDGQDQRADATVTAYRVGGGATGVLDPTVTAAPSVTSPGASQPAHSPGPGPRTTAPSSTSPASTTSPGPTVPTDPSVTTDPGVTTAPAPPSTSSAAPSSPTTTTRPTGPQNTKTKPPR